MGVLRKDYILERWVYYATERKKRPREFKKDLHYAPDLRTLSIITKKFNKVYKYFYF